MSTRSRIAVVQTDGKVKSVYCHSDGYYSHLGDMLLNHHNTEEKANELVALGDLSCLYEHLKPLPEAPASHFYGKSTPPTVLAEEHSFDNPQKDVTIAYHRDRGEDFNQNISETLEKYNANGTNVFEEYNYLWNEGKWFIRDNSNKWIELTEEIVKNDIPENA